MHIPRMGFVRGKELRVCVKGVTVNYGEGHGNPLQCSGLENPLDRRAWWAAVHGIAKSQAGTELWDLGLSAERCEDGGGQ